MLNRQRNNNVFITHVLLFCSLIGYSQLKLKDSTWLPIYVKDSTVVSYQESNANYNTLFYKSIYVPKYEDKSSNYQLKPLTLDLSELLSQTGLDNSYKASEVKGTELENTLRNVEKLSFPFASSLTSKLAKQLKLLTNDPIIVAHNDNLYQLSAKEKNVLSTPEALKRVYDSSSVKFNQSAYLRHQLLNFIIGNTNVSYKDYHWKEMSISGGNTIEPYIDSYQNQYMNFDGTYKLITKLIRSYKHIEPYTARIKSVKKVSQKFIGFDVNVLSNMPFELWETEMNYVQETLNDNVIDEFMMQLPKGVVTSETELLCSTLKQRIKNIKDIGTTYYNLTSPHKVVAATNTNNLIDIKRTDNGVTIHVYNEIDGKKNPIKSYEFSSNETKDIWIYGLKGNDYFEVSGHSKTYIPIKLIGGKNSDKYEISNGKNIVVYDDKNQTFVVHQDKAKFKLSNDNAITKYDVAKYKHNTNNVKPKFGANPDDGLFVGVVNEYKVLDFNQNPFSQLHQVSANFYLGTQGFNVGYYGEKSNVYKGFSAFVNLGYQSPNYSSNFFGYGNETPNYDDNLKLDYNRVRMENVDVAIGILKRHKNYNVSTNVFFESRKIDDTPDRFVSSETLFFPEDGFFDRKNYVGISGEYVYKTIEFPIIEDLIIKPKMEFKITANTNEFSKTNSLIQPSIFFEHPFYNDKISLDAKLTYQDVFGEDVPFYQAATIGGSSGLRGYRNQRFSGQSSLVTSTNLKWFIKDLESDILPLQFGVLGGFDAGRVWLENEDSSNIYTDFGAGLWLQTADLIKAQLQAFKGNEGMRFAFHITIGF
jgi:hypothetical protein